MSTRVIILAAGKGKRMGADVPKPLVEIAGRPMVEHLIDSVHESGIDESPILVVAPDSLEQFRSICREDRCEFAIQEEQLGTGHATMSARESANGADRIMVLNGDHPFFTPELLQQVIDTHKEAQAMMTIVTTKVPNFKGDHSLFTSWGRIIRDDVHRVVTIREFKDATDEEKEIKELNAGAYLFDAEWLWDHLPEIENKNASGEYYIVDLVAMAVEEGSNVATTQAEPMEVVGINTKEELERAEALLG